MKQLGTVLLLCGLAFSQARQGQQPSRMTNRPANSPGPAQQMIATEVQHQLEILPFYTIFDDLKGQVNGNTVTLTGDVVNDSVKDEAEEAVKGIPGVGKIDDQIKVLPPSITDQDLRMQLSTAIFSSADLYKYVLGVTPKFRIIVENGQVTLKGVVGSDKDKNLAATAAKKVPGVSAVNNDLTVGAST